MSKTYPETKNESTMAAEPVTTYAVRGSSYAPKKALADEEDILANTMSVDAYFDELISLVHKDYATNKDE